MVSMLFSCKNTKEDSKEVALNTSDTISENTRAIWSQEEANAWYAKQPWLVGANFNPSNAINQLEMWQEICQMVAFGYVYSDMEWKIMSNKHYEIIVMRSLVFTIAVHSWCLLIMTCQI